MSPRPRIAESIGYRAFAPSCSPDIAAFVTAMVGTCQPRTVVELGVASGVSRTVLDALDRLPDIEGGRLLYSCDVRRAIDDLGLDVAVVAHTAPQPSDRVRWRTESRVHPRRLAEALPRFCADLTILDAGRAHPRPLLDLLHAAGVAKRGSWVLLPDVDRLAASGNRRHATGARRLFDAWPFAKERATVGAVEMGALRLPEDFADLVPVALALLARPWEQVPTWQDADLPSVFAEVHEHLRFQIAPDGRFSLAG
jgi:hypothetical protein